jgi:predicted nucleic acid-binding protein
VVGARGAAYLDASAIVKLVLAEPESGALRGLLSERPRRLSSRIAEVEVNRAIARVAQPGDEAQVRLVLSGLQFVELDADVARVAASLTPPALRSLDAIHLASALVVSPELDVFVTYDTRLVNAGRAAGLEVRSPA